MAHHTAVEIQVDIGRRGSLSQNVRSIEFAIKLVKLKMTSSTRLMHKVNPEIDVFGTLTAAGPQTEPSDQEMHVSLSAKTAVGAVCGYPRLAKNLRR